MTIPAINNKVAGISSNALGNVAACQSSSNLTDGGTDIWVYTLYPIVPIAAPIAQFVYSPRSGAVPLTVNFDALLNLGPNGQEVNYDWVFGDGGSASGRSVSHVFTSGGSFPVRLTVLDNINRVDAIVQTVEVEKANPQPPLQVSGKVSLSGFWSNPKITYRFSWAANPANIPAQIIGYAVYMREDNGAFRRILTLPPGELSTVLTFAGFTVKRSFAFSTLGLGDTESELVALR